MRKYSVKASIAIILSMLMAFLVPVQAIAEVLPDVESPEQVTFVSSGEVVTANIVSELESKRDETTKHFRMDDGTIMAVNYGTPVHYKDDKGEWVEYDNTLIVDENADTSTPDEITVDSYVNKNSNLDISLSSDSQKDELIDIGGKKGNISWKYADPKRSNAKVKNNNKKYTGNEKFTNIDKMTSTAQYDNIYDNVDLECIVSPNGVKENIILENKKAQNEFEIEYKFKGLTAKQIDTQNIKLYDKNDKEVYTISAPYMYDAEGNVSEDVTLEIISNKNNKLTVKLVADKGFINSWGRKFPVTIDPEVVIEGRSSTNVATISADSPDSTVGSSSWFSIGEHNNYGTCYGLVKPVTYTTLSDKAEIVSAKISMAPYNISGNMSIDVREVAIDWDNSTVTYNSINAGEILQNEVIDYATVEEIKYTSSAAIEGYYFNADITKIVKEWDLSREGSIYGILLSSDNTTECCQLWGTNTPSSFLAPVITIIYKEYNGSEEHLTSHTVSCGQNAEVSVVDYTGDMVIKQNLFSESGSRFPMNLYTTYHSAENTDDNNVGMGWRMSFDKNITLSDGYYIYEDADGVKHYFKAEEGATELYDEDDAGYTLTISNSKITVDDGSVIYEFEPVADSATSKVKSETDVDNSNNVITYTYNSSGLLTTIKSTFGTYTIGYSTSSYSTSGKCISTITLPDSSKIYCIYYGGTNKLARFKFANGISTYFTFNADGTRVGGVSQRGSDDVYSYRVYCDYDSNYKVFKVKEYGYNTTSSSWTLGNYLNISYGADNTTKFTDKQNRSQTYTFDNYGNTISVLNANGYIQNVGDSEILEYPGGSDSYTKNYLDVSSEPEGIGGNNYYSRLDGTIGDETSSGGSVTVDTTNAYLGNKSIKIEHTKKTQFYTGVYREFNATAFKGKTLTLSSYVKTNYVNTTSRGGKTGAIAKIICFDSGGTQLSEAVSLNVIRTFTSTGWQRISATATISDDVAKFRVYFCLRNMLGTVWFDCMQLEEGDVANDYNALSNSDFSSTSNWSTPTGKFALTDGKAKIVGLGGGEPYSEITYDELYGEDDDNTSENTTESTSESTTEPATRVVTATEIIDEDSISEYDKYDNLKKEQNGTVIREVKKYYYVDEATEAVQESTESADSGTTDNEDTDTDTDTDTTETVVKDKVYQTIPINKKGICFNISGTASANSVPLSTGDRTFGIALRINYKDGEIEEHYTEFNCFTTAEQNVAMSITPDNTAKEISTVTFMFVYEHNKNEMILKNAMLNIGLTQFDMETLSDTVEPLDEEDLDNLLGTGEDEETDDEPEDNYFDYEIVNESIDKTKPYMENTYEYDTTGNYTTKEIDGAGNTTQYGYDSLGNLTSVTYPKGNTIQYTYDSTGDTTSVTDGSATIQYTYDSYHRLSAINHNSFAYTYNYDIYNNLISTYVGETALATNTYASSNGNLTRSTFGNGDYFAYTYDKYDRVKTITSEAGLLAEYVYNKKGLVAKLVDHKADETTYYEYDCNGNLVYKGNEIRGSYSSYYDSEGNLVEVKAINGIKSELTVGMNDDCDTYIDNNGTILTTRTDEFDRISEIQQAYEKNNISIDFVTNIGYIEGAESNNKYTTEQVGSYSQSFNGTDLSEYSYKYDANGNITKVYVDGEEKLRFSYNSLGQLSSCADANTMKYTFYTYDTAGNILKKTEQQLNIPGWYPTTTLATYTYNYDSTWKDKLSSYNGDTITYDEIGNPTTYRNGITMTWENGRELKSFTKDGKTTNFTYDINGMRTRKRTGNTITDYYYDDNNVLYGLRYQSNYFFFYYDENGEISSMLVDGYVPYFFEKNAQGDVIGIINENGVRVVSYTYDAWGNPTTTLDAEGNDVTNGAWAKAVPFRYRGYIYDTETGLYYLQSRFYDPQTGRFVNADAYTNTETGTPYSANMFAYCENNPVVNVDPTGYWHYKKHRRITRLQGFKGEKYKLVRDWSMNADFYPCASTVYYSAPFHSQPDSLQGARELYNYAMYIWKNKTKLKFSFYDEPQNGEVGVKYANWAFKEPEYSRDWATYRLEWTYAQLDFENKINNETSSYEEQSRMLLGLVLHMVQDYSAHLIPVTAIVSETGYYANDRKYYFVDTNGNPYNMTKLHNIFTDVPKLDLEDNKDVFPWRMAMARKVTRKILRKWEGGKYIDSFDARSSSITDTYRFNTVNYTMDGIVKYCVIETVKHDWYVKGTKSIKWKSECYMY